MCIWFSKFTRIIIQLWSFYKIRILDWAYLSFKWDLDKKIKMRRLPDFFNNRAKHDFPARSQFTLVIGFFWTTYGVILFKKQSKQKQKDGILESKKPNDDLILSFWKKMPRLRLKLKCKIMEIILGRFYNDTSCQQTKV